MGIDIEMFTLTDIEEILHCTHRSLLSYVYEGKLKAVKISGKWYVSRKNLEAFLNGDTTQQLLKAKASRSGTVDGETVKVKRGRGRPKKTE